MSETNDEFAARVRTARRTRAHGWSLWECCIWHRDKHNLVYLYLIFPHDRPRAAVCAEVDLAVPHQGVTYDIQCLRVAPRVVERHFAKAIERRLQLDDAWGVLSWEDNAPLYVGDDDETSVPVQQWREMQERANG